MNKLALLVDNYINDNGFKYNYIAGKLGMSRQALYNLLKKKNFTIDDANRILATIGFQISYDIKPIDKE